MSEELLALTVDIVSAHVSNNTVSPSELPSLISSVHKALADTAPPVAPEAPKQDPAVSIRSSVKPDYIVSLESGKKMKMLKRYLMTNYGITPDDYRRKWGLPNDYPMVAPNYAQQRKELAVKIGLGRGGRKSAAKPTAKSSPNKAKADASKGSPTPPATLKVPLKKPSVTRSRPKAGTSAKPRKRT